MSGYGQFCPVAKAMELLDERWTVLVIRELMVGSRHFSALQRGHRHLARQPQLGRGHQDR